MASIAISAQGSLLKIGDGATTEVFTTVPEVMDVSTPEVKFDYLEVTSHDSAGGFKEWVAGLKDGGTLSVTFNFVPSNTIHQGLRTDSYAATRRNFKLVLTGATMNTVTFSAYIEFKVDAKKGAILAGSSSLRVTGLPVWS